MRGIHIFEKPYYREIRTMRGRPMRGSPVQRSNNMNMGHFGKLLLPSVHLLSFLSKTVPRSKLGVSYEWDSR